MTDPAVPEAGPAARDRALAVLLGDELEPIVDLVAWSPAPAPAPAPAPGVYEAASARGHLRFSRRPDGSTDSGHPRWAYDTETLSGDSPLHRQDPSHFGTLEAEKTVPHPRRHDNSYPHAVEQFGAIWSGRHRGRSWARPAFTWVNFTLTDAAFHEGGPYSEIAAASVRDTDTRIGHILDAVERSGAWDHTAFVLVADHGTELADPEVTGDWDVALAEHGVSVRDEGYGFLYLTSA